MRLNTQINSIWLANLIEITSSTEQEECLAPVLSMTFTQRVNSKIINLTVSAEKSNFYKKANNQSTSAISRMVNMMVMANQSVEMVKYKKEFGTNICKANAKLCLKRNQVTQLRTLLTLSYHTLKTLMEHQRSGLKKINPETIQKMNQMSWLMNLTNLSECQVKRIQVVKIESHYISILSNFI